MLRTIRFTLSVDKGLSSLLIFLKIIGAANVVLFTYFSSLTATSVLKRDQKTFYLLFAISISLSFSLAFWQDYLIFFWVKNILLRYLLNNKELTLINISHHLSKESKLLYDEIIDLESLNSGI